MTGTKKENAEGHARDAHDEASAWFLRLRNDNSPEALEAFAGWRAEDESHRSAYDDIRMVWLMMDDASAEPEIVTARRDALTRARRAVKLRWGRDNWSHFAVVAACFLFAIIAAPLLWRAGPSSDVQFSRYETDIGETRVVTLADNSKISLDARTALTVRYTPDLRLISLDSGQAYFDVAKDPSRPFRVTANGKTVIALGTSFNMELVSGNLLVTIVEGRVAVTDAEDGRGENAAAPKAAMLQDVQELLPGERLVADASGAATVFKNADIVKTTAWRRGKLIFEDEPLIHAVERMNRYSRIRLVVADENIASLGVSGVFNAGDTEAFVEALEAYFDVDAQSNADGGVIIHASR